ncbi:MAG: HhH-GPD-type base excision DNA repair protein [Rhodothermales bacterium]|nr:HhH-GPD-type base excision DNA repair protein [Rhodothermales bacterium]
MAEPLSPAADYSYLDGGLVRMLDRLQQEGTATKDPDADQFLRDDPNAVLIGLLLDQRVLAETAFTGPLKLKERLGHFEMARLADHDPDDFKRVFSESPAVHRFTNTMADRVQAVARILADEHDGTAAGLWSDGADLDTVEKRVKKLPGFGPLKAQKLKHCLYYFQNVDLSEPR